MSNTIFGKPLDQLGGQLTATQQAAMAAMQNDYIRDYIRNSGMANTTATASAYTSASKPAKPQNDTTVLQSANVEKIDNGYLVTYCVNGNTPVQRTFIDDLSKLGDVLVAAIVAERVEA